jgi:large subunit ribosomal protein L10
MVNKYKQLQLKEIRERFVNFKNAIFMDFSKCSATKISQFRVELSKNNLQMFVIKNSLAKLAFSSIDSIGSKLTEKITGQNALIYGDDPIVLSKSVKTFLEKNQEFKIKFVFFEGNIYDKNIVTEYAAYNSKGDLIANLLVRLKQPLNSLVFDLRFILVKFIRVLNELANKSK